MILKTRMSSVVGKLCHMIIVALSCCVCLFFSCICKSKEQCCLDIHHHISLLHCLLRELHALGLSCFDDVAAIKVDYCDTVV